MRKLFYLSHVLMAPAGDPPAGGGGGAPELIEVDLPDIGKVMLPKEQATKAIATRDANKARLRELETELGKHRMTAEEADRKRVKAEEDRQAIEAAKNGEVDKVRELMTKDHRQQVDKLASKYRDMHLRAAITALPEFIVVKDEAEHARNIDLIVSVLRSSCQYDLSQDTLQVLGPDGRPALGADGRPLAVDAYLRDFIGKHSILRKSSSSPGSGAGGKGQGEQEIPEITRDAFTKATEAGDTATLMRVATKKLRVVDG